jgi:hypothetical protein
MLIAETCGEEVDVPHAPHAIATRASEVVMRIFMRST